VSKVSEIVLEENSSLTTQTKNWPVIFKRLNATGLAMQNSIFLKEGTDNKKELNMLSQMLSINISMIHGLIESQEIDDNEIPEDIKNVFRLHIEFETFIYTKFVEKVNETDDFDEIQEFLKKNFREVYCDTDFKELILNFSKGNMKKGMETPQKFKTKSSLEWSNRESGRNMHTKRSGFSDSSFRGNTQGRDIRNNLTMGPSTNSNPMTFKKKSQPQEMYEEQGTSLKEEHFPEYKEVSIKTDSEIEELNKNKQKFKLLNKKSSQEKMFADVLGFEDQDSSHVASR
jgi:hypothetical protein